MKEQVTLSQTELNRVLVLQRVVDGEVSVREAALVLGLSERHVKRLKKTFRLFGPGALAHGNRGRKPAHTIPEDVRRRVIELAQTTFRGCNDTFLSELLDEYEGIRISPSSVRRILRAAGIPSPRKHRPPKIHRRRQRKPQTGMLVLIDGSEHDWLEGRGPRLTLLAAIDDATGQILAAVFRRTEDFEGYRQLLHQLVSTHGIPIAVYTDRHTLFRSPRADDPPSPEHQLLGQPRPLSQVGRILSELGIQHILARSPQARGRIERAFGTLQERLRIALRRAGASNLDQANAILQDFIPRYNQRFARLPADAQSAFRPLPAHLRLKHIFCWKEHRTLNPGYVIHYDRQTYRVVIPKGAPVIPLRTVVEVHHFPSGHIAIAYRGHIYPVEPFVEPAKTRSTDTHRTNAREKAGATSPRRPAPDHPWRRPWAPCRPYSTTGVTKSLTSFG